MPGIEDQPEIEVKTDEGNAQKQPLLPAAEAAPPLIPIHQALIDAFIKGTPFAVSALAAGTTIPVSLIAQRLGGPSVAAFAYITTLQNLVMGPGRGALLSTGLGIGVRNGQEDYAAIGRFTRQGWIYAMIISAGAIAALLNSGNVVEKIFGADPEVAQEVQEYFKYYSIGIIPTFLSVVDQQVTVGVKKKLHPLLQGLSYGIFSAIFAALFALGYVHSALTGTAGLGLGVALGATATWLWFHLSLLADEFKKYQIHRLDFTNGRKDFAELISVGIKIAFHVIAEWLNLEAVAISLGLKGPTALVSVEPSIEVIATAALYNLGSAQVVGTGLSNSMGEIKKALANGNQARANAISNNMRREGYAGIAESVIMTSLLAILCLAIPEIMTDSFLPADTDPSVKNTAALLLMVNSLGLVFDTARNVEGGALRAAKDILFTTLTSLFFMTVCGVSLGDGLTLGLDEGLSTYFWIRNASIAISALLVLHRWDRFSRLTPEQKQETMQYNLDAPAHRTVFHQPRFEARDPHAYAQLAQ